MFGVNFIRRRFCVLFLVFYIIFFGTIITLGSVKQMYINESITRFNQLLKVVGPYISNEQKTLYESSFAQIRNGYDYDKLIESLEKIAKEKQQKIPEIGFIF